MPELAPPPLELTEITPPEDLSEPPPPDLTPPPPEIVRMPGLAPPPLRLLTEIVSPDDLAEPPPPDLAPAPEVLRMPDLVPPPLQKLADIVPPEELAEPPPPETMPPPQRDELVELPRQRPKPEPPVRRVETPPPPVAQPERTPLPPVEETPPQQVASLPAPIPAPTAPPGPTSQSPEALAAYGGSLFHAINTTATRNYPARALKRRQEGVVPMRLTIDADGALVSAIVLDKSEAPSRLITAALKAVQKAAPFPAFSNDLGNDQRQFDVRIVYKIR